MTEQTKTTIKTEEGISLEVSAKYIDTVKGFPFVKDDQNYHNHFEISIKNLDTDEFFTSDFYGSARDCDNGIIKLNHEGLMDAIDCIISDGMYAEYSFEEFCDELGYDTDSRTAERIYNAVLKTSDKWGKIGFTPSELYDLSQFLHDLQEQEGS